MSLVKKTIPIVIELPTPKKCAACLYINTKGDRHFDCHHTKPSRDGRTNEACPAGKYVIIDFNVELWAARYARDQANGHLKNMRVIQNKLNGLDEETLQRFWRQVNFNIALAMGADVEEDGEETGEVIATDDVEVRASNAVVAQLRPTREGAMVSVDVPAEVVAEAADEEQVEAEDEAEQPVASDGDDNDEWED